MVGGCSKPTFQSSPALKHTQVPGSCTDAMGPSASPPMIPHSDGTVAVHIPLHLNQWFLIFSGLETTFFKRNILGGNQTLKNLVFPGTTT